MSDTIDEVRLLMQNRLAEIETEKGVLERAIAALGEGSDPRPGRRRRARSSEAPTPAPPRPSTSKAPEARPAKRAPRGRRREELIAAIEADPGARPRRSPRWSASPRPRSASCSPSSAASG